jgi:hypothetical protein
VFGSAAVWPARGAHVTDTRGDIHTGMQVVAHLQMEGFSAAPLTPPSTWDPPDIVQQLAFATTLSHAASHSRLGHAERYPYDLGALLMNFLHFFGTVFDPATHGVSVRQGGIVSRDAAGGHKHKEGVAIEDPQVSTRTAVHVAVAPLVVVRDQG